jgi:hypothetical protein
MSKGLVDYDVNSLLQVKGLQLSNQGRSPGRVQMLAFSTSPSDHDLINILATDSVAVCVNVQANGGDPT